jgi:hypothetical protein
MECQRQRSRIRAIRAMALLAAIVWISCREPPPREIGRRDDNERPFGNLDAPPNGAVVGREVEVSGWAADDTKVSEVRILVDGQHKATATLKHPRPDVTKVFPRYAVPDDRHGWWEIVDLGERGGSHTILAQAIDEEGASRDIGSVVVNLIER